MSRAVPLLAVAASCLLCLRAGADTLLLPLRYADATEICDMLSGKAAAGANVAVGAGDGTIVPLREHSAIVVQGSAPYLAEVQAIVAILDRPIRRIGLEVRVVVPPAELRDPAALRDAALVAGPGTGRPGMGPFEATLARLRLKGARILEPIGGGTRTVTNNRSTTLWFGDDFVWLRETKPLAVGLAIAPRVNADETISMRCKWVRAGLDQNAKPQVETVPAKYGELQVTALDGQSVLVATPMTAEVAPGNEAVFLLLRPLLLTDRPQAAGP
jgi:hypothetical protein